MLPGGRLVRGIRKPPFHLLPSLLTHSSTPQPAKRRFARYLTHRTATSKSGQLTFTSTTSRQRSPRIDPRHETSMWSDGEGSGDVRGDRDRAAKAVGRAGEKQQEEYRQRDREVARSAKTPRYAHTQSPTSLQDISQQHRGRGTGDECPLLDDPNSREYSYHLTAPTPIFGAFGFNVAPPDNRRRSAYRELPGTTRQSR